jgi:4Fe-4S single cluster domain
MPESKAVKIGADGTPVIIFGAASVGEALFHACQEAGITVDAFCDNNANLARDRRCGLEIIPARNLKQRFPDAEVIISAADISDVVNQLEGMGYRKWHSCSGLLRNFDIYPYTYVKPADFVAHTVAAALLCHDAYTTPDKLFLRCVDLMITEKCSLKCKDCANLMQFYDKPISDDTAEMLQSIERFCAVVDEINEMRVLGGEAFMNKDAHIIIKRLIDEPKVKKVVVYSNATIVPSKDQMALMRSKKVLFFITDYGDLSRNRERLVRELDANEIAYISSPPSNWTDCGKIVEHHRTEEEQKKIFGTCCVKNIYTISGNLLFHCPFSANAFRLKAVPHFKGDYVDFSSPDSKPALREFIRHKEYIESCDFCNGRTHGNPEIVPGIQTLVTLKYDKHVW